MPASRVKELLDSHGMKYVVIKHSPAYTAQEIAASAHVPGKELAKTVMVRLDGKLAMAVVPASQRVDLQKLAAVAGAQRAELATEDEFAGVFPGCEVGAMPPFGNLYGIPVYVSDALSECEEIAFNAGTHRELLRMRYDDYARLVNPVVGAFGL